VLLSAPTAAANTVRGALVRDVKSVLGDLRSEEAEVAKLPALQSAAREAHLRAAGTDEPVRTLTEKLGADIEPLRGDIAEARSTLADLETQVDPLGAAALTTAETLATKRAELKNCQVRVEELGPAAAQAAGQLRTLYRCPASSLRLHPQGCPTSCSHPRRRTWWPWPGA
jgi:hypothetical protein